MKSLVKFVAVLAIPAVLAGPLATAAAAADDAPAKTSTVKDEMLFWINDAESKLGELAEAMPQEKYTWRPGEGVRSPAEVFLHVAAANYSIPKFWGVTPPEGFESEGFEHSQTMKADIEKTLKDSFEHVKSALTAASDEDLQKSATVFGIPTTARGGYMLLLSHQHEHLGQSIAYARVNGVVPPWSARQAEAAKKKKEGE